MSEHQNDHRHPDRATAIDDEQHRRAHEPAFGWYPHQHKVPERGKTVWLQAGRSGKRVPNDAQLIERELNELMAWNKAERAMVHADACNVGRTTLDECDCYPVEVVR
jgi:hypothetical protein